jgi:Predicted helicase
VDTTSTKPDYYLFKPRDEDLLSFYEKFSKITDIFPVNSVGIVTARDDFAVSFDRNVLERRIRQFVDKNLPDEVIKYTFNLYDTSKFKLSESRKEVMQEPNWQKHIVKLLYRPFDERWVFYHDSVVERTRKEVMQHMLMGENLGLITSRIIKGDKYQHTFVSCNITDAALLAANTASSSYLFPLYLYTKQEKPKKKSVKLSSWLIFEPRADYSIVRKPNISGEIFEKLAGLYNEIPSPEKILYYIYAILYSNTYRTKYAEFLEN